MLVISTEPIYYVLYRTEDPDGHSKLLSIF